MIRATLLFLFGLSINASFASIITHEQKDLKTTSAFSILENSRYATKYQDIANLISTGDLEKAKLALAQILTATPFDTRALEISGNLLLSEGNVKAALNAYERSASLNRTPNTLAKIGVCYLMLNDFTKAKISLTQAVSLQPNNPLGLRYLAWIEGNSFNQSAELYYLSKLVALNIDNSVFHEFDAAYIVSLLDNQQTKNALQFIEKHRGKFIHTETALKNSIKLLEIEALAKAGKPVQAYDSYTKLKPQLENLNANIQQLEVFLFAKLKLTQKAKTTIAKMKDGQQKRFTTRILAEVLFNNDDFEQSASLLRELLAEDIPSTERANYIDDLTAVYVVQSRYRDAINVVKNEIKKYADSPSLKYQLAELYVLAGRTSAAMKEFDKLLSSNPNFLPAYIGKGRQLSASGEPNDVNAYYQEAITKQPALADLSLDYAKYLVKNNEPNRAIQVLESNLTLQKNNPLISFELATLYDSQNFLDKSEPLYLTIIGQYPEYLPAIDNLATNLFALEKDIDKAIVLAKRAYALSPDDIYIKNLRAQAFIHENKSAEAIDMLEPVIDKFESNGLGHYTLALAYAKLHKSQKAKTLLTEAVKKGLPNTLNKKANELVLSI